MIDMCKKVGFKVDYIGFDSAWAIYSLSEGYMTTLKSHKELMESITISEEYDKRARESNRNGRGDNAIFYLRRP
jgi:hypothetical protein